VNFRISGFKDFRIWSDLEIGGLQKFGNLTLSRLIRLAVQILKSPQFAKCSKFLDPEILKF